MNVTTKQGKLGTLTIDTKVQNATLTVNGVKHLISFIRDNKVVIKSDLFLNDGDMAYVKSELSKFIKKEETGKKRK